MERRFSAGTFGLLALIVILAWLNVFQYLAPPPPMVVSASPAPPEKRPATVPIDLGDDRNVVDRFHELAYDQQFRHMRHGGDFRVATEDYTPSRWLGVITQQNPNDVWIHQEIISEQKPDVIVETGTLLGGGALLWATILTQVNPEGRVLTIDITDRVKEAKGHPLWRRSVDQIVGSSTDPVVVADVKKRVAGKKVLVLLDSDHSKGHVLNELKLYAPMVAPGGYVIVQDGNVNGHPVVPDFGPGPYEATEEFLASDDRFIADRSLERFLFTMHPKGYLKRVK